MNTYAIQQHKITGETYALEYDQGGDTIVGMCGPLATVEVDELLTMMDTAPHWHYEPTDSDGLGKDGLVEWQYPIATYDPNIGEVWLA